MTTRRSSTRRRRILVPYVFEPSDSPKGSGSSSSSLEDSDSAEDWKPAKAGKKRKMVRRRKNRAFLSSSDSDSDGSSAGKKKRDTKRKKRAKRSKLGTDTGDEASIAEEEQEGGDGEEKDENLPVKKAGKMKSTESLGDDVMPNQKINKISRGTDSQMEKLAESGLKANGPKENVKQNPEEIPKEKPDMSTDPKKRDPPVQRNLIAPNTCQTPVQEIPRGTDSEMKDLANSALEVNGAKENPKENVKEYGKEKLTETPYTPTDPEKTVSTDLPVKKTRKMKSTESPGQDVLLNQQFSDPKEISRGTESEMEMLPESGLKTNGTKEKLTTKPETPMNQKETDSNDLPAQRNVITPNSHQTPDQKINDSTTAKSPFPTTVDAMNGLISRMESCRLKGISFWDGCTWIDESDEDEEMHPVAVDVGKSELPRLLNQITMMMKLREAPKRRKKWWEPDEEEDDTVLMEDVDEMEEMTKGYSTTAPKPSAPASDNVDFDTEIPIPKTAMNVVMKKVPTAETMSILDEKNVQSTSGIKYTLRIRSDEWMVKKNELPRRGNSGGSAGKMSRQTIPLTPSPPTKPPLPQITSFPIKTLPPFDKKPPKKSEWYGRRYLMEMEMMRLATEKTEKLAGTDSAHNQTSKQHTSNPIESAPNQTDPVPPNLPEPSATTSGTGSTGPPPSSPQLTPEIRYEGIPLPTAAPSIPHCGDVYILLNSECKEHGMVPDFYVRTVKELGFELTAEDLEPKTSISANAAGQQIFFGRFQIRKSDVNKEFSKWLNAVERDEMIDQKNKQKYGDDKGKFVYIYKYYNDHDSAACVFLHKLFLRSAPTPGIRLVFSARKFIKWSSGEIGKVLVLADFFSGIHDELVREIHGGFTRTGRKMITEVTARLGVPRSFWRREAQNRLG